jgi:uncharacterized hydrophobic protein (TIGR00271 family)
MSLDPTKTNKYAAIRQLIVDESDLNRSYMIMNCLAAVIATFGLLANSIAVVIGAMIVATLLGPITGFGLSLTDGNHALLKRSFESLSAGLLGVYLISFIIGVLNFESPITNEIMVRTSPNLFDLMIALASGAAGAYAMISPRLSVAFVGVAIATALVPPLSSSAILLVHGEYQLSWGAFLLTLTNITGIQFANSLVLWLNGFHKQIIKGNSIISFLRSQSATLIVLLILSIFLTYNLNKVIRMHLFEAEVRSCIQEKLKSIPESYLTDLRVDNASSKDKVIIRAEVRSPNSISPSKVAIMESSLPSPPNGKKLELRIQRIWMDVVTLRGDKIAF